MKTKISLNIKKRNVLKIKKNDVDEKNCKVFGTKYLKKRKNSAPYNCKC